MKAANEREARAAEPKEGRKRDRRVEWCPPSKYQEYRDLADNRGFTAAEARAIIEGELRRVSA